MPYNLKYIRLYNGSFVCSLNTSTDRRGHLAGQSQTDTHTAVSGSSGGDVMCVLEGLNWKEQHCSFQLSSRSEAGFRQTAHEENVNDLF